jgi:L-gulono-1,4-lactone dehydrogenase
MFGNPTSLVGKNSRRNGAAPKNQVPIALASEEDIVSAIRLAREHGCCVRAVGSRGSKNDCYCTCGLTLEPELYSKILSFDGDTVTVQSGTTIGQLNEFLRQRDRVIPTCGEWTGGTVAGSVSTGSHGGSCVYGIHSCSIRSIRLITAAGIPLDIDRQNPLFDHTAVSLGALGVISTITFDCVPAFFLELESRVVPFERYLEAHDELNRQHEFFSALWFPTARRVMTFGANRVSAPGETASRKERYCPKTVILNRISRNFNLNLLSDRLLAWTAIDHADRILCPISRTSTRIKILRYMSHAWREVEVAVPLTQATDTLAQLDPILAENRRAVMSPVGLRTSAADTFTLSPCYGRDVFWIDIFCKAHRDFCETLRSFLEARESRCHWGKHIPVSAEYLRRQYPRWEEFRQARLRLDPEGIFASPFTRRFDL